MLTPCLLAEGTRQRLSRNAISTGAAARVSITILHWRRRTTFMFTLDTCVVLVYSILRSLSFRAGREAMRTRLFYLPSWFVLVASVASKEIQIARAKGGSFMFQYYQTQSKRASNCQEQNTRNLEKKKFDWVKANSCESLLCKAFNMLQFGIVLVCQSLPNHRVFRIGLTTKFSSYASGRRHTPGHSYGAAHAGQAVALSEFDVVAEAFLAARHCKVFKQVMR